MTPGAGDRPLREGMLPVAEALAIVLEVALSRPRKIEDIAVEAADGRVLAGDLAALRSQPPYDASSMDGFALGAADTHPPGRPLRLIGESAAGHPFAGTIGPGEAIRISTGARLPEGADAVLMQEQADVAGETVSSHITVSPGAFIRRAGRDFSAGETLLGAGIRLTPGAIALAGAMNHARIPVFHRPRLAILATGDELVPPGTPDAPEAIVATNGYAIAALCRAAGAEVRELGIARDEPGSVNAAVDAAEAWRADCLVTIGGASAGVHDIVSAVVSARGARRFIGKVALRPGKPFNFSILATGLLVVGLPGNPISALICARLFLLPMVAALQGDAKAGETGFETVELGCDLPANDERQDHLRAWLAHGPAGQLVATPMPDQDSSLLSVYARAEALVIRPPHAPAAKTGDPCRILRL